LGNSGSDKTLSAGAGGSGGTISGSGIVAAVGSSAGSWMAGVWMVEGWVLGGSGLGSAAASAMTGGVITASAGASSMRDSTTATCIPWK
jgi:hypothetical protein